MLVANDVMKIGTKSVLFGIHCFFIHPVVVALAWRRYWDKWPQHLSEWVAIICHDLGYWNCPEIDGPCGKQHPWRSAHIAEKVMAKLGRPKDEQIAAVLHVLGHSRSFCKEYGFRISPLCAPDKLSVIFEPRWFYFLRSTLSGELNEFVDNAWRYGYSSKYMWQRWKWINWYKDKVRYEFKKEKAANTKG